MLLNPPKHQRPDIDKTCLYVKELSQSKHQLFINGREKSKNKKLKYPKTFIDDSQTIDHVYENLEHYNPKRKGEC